VLDWARILLADKEVQKYVSHIAVHFYRDETTSTSILDTMHTEYPNTPLFATEACIEAKGSPDAVVLGSWERAERYCDDIIEDLNHWFVGWIDWNLVLDLNGGPNWAKNTVDSPVIVNATSGEFYKQPMFYALGHFSKFLPAKSVRIGLTSNIKSANVNLTAFLNTDGYKTVILMNKDNADTSLLISDATTKEAINVTLPARSIVTVLWKNPTSPQRGTRLALQSMFIYFVLGFFITLFTLFFF